MILLVILSRHPWCRRQYQPTRLRSARQGTFPEASRSAPTATDSMMHPIKALTMASLRGDAEASPDTTVVSAWAYVETAIYSDLARVLGISDVPSFALDADAVLSELTRRGARPGPQSTRSVLRRLLRRRTSVERGEHVSAAEAYDFGADALHVTDLLLGAYAKTQGQARPRPPGLTNGAAGTRGAGKNSCDGQLAPLTRRRSVRLITEPSAGASAPKRCA